MLQNMSGTKPFGQRCVNLKACREQTLYTVGMSSKFSNERALSVSLPSVFTRRIISLQDFAETALF